MRRTRELLLRFFMKAEINLQKNSTQLNFSFAFPVKVLRPFPQKSSTIHSIMWRPIHSHYDYHGFGYSRGSATSATSRASNHQSVSRWLWTKGPKSLSTNSHFSSYCCPLLIFHEYAFLLREVVFSSARKYNHQKCYHEIQLCKSWICIKYQTSSSFPIFVTFAVKVMLLYWSYSPK